MEKIEARRIVLAARPQGKPVESDFRLETFEVSEPGQDQLLLRILYLTIDPYMRGRMDDKKSYAQPVQIGGILGGESVAEVVTSKNSKFTAGDIVLAPSGWQTYFISNGQGLRKLDPAFAPITTALGVLGMPGFTAYSGMRVIGQAKKGETVVVAAASGPVGSLVGQIAKRAGARAIGIAGGAEKCAYVRDELKFDVALDHKSKNFNEELKAACPKGIDVYFENVGGPIWDAVLPLLNLYARVPVCGLIAQYNGASEAERAHSVASTMRAILNNSLTLRGFINSEFSEFYPDFLKEIGQGIKDGEIKYKEDVVDGFEKCPKALMDILEGKNYGKLLVKV